MDTTWYPSEEENEENVDPNETKLFKLRSLRIETKDGVTSKFKLESVVAPKQRNSARPSAINLQAAVDAPVASTSSGIASVNSDEANVSVLF